MKAQILELLYDKGALDYRQIAELLGKSEKSVSGRLSELSRMGLVEKQGSTYVLTEKGKRVVELMRTGLNFDEALKQTVSAEIKSSVPSVLEISRVVPNIFSELNILGTTPQSRVKVSPRAMQLLGNYLNIVVKSAEREFSSCDKIKLDAMDVGDVDEEWVIVATCLDTGEVLGAVLVKELFRYLKSAMGKDTKPRTTTAEPVAAVAYK
jgi:DNA-binding MarR family transcriptional regulator